MTQNEYKALVAEILRHNDLYYNQDKPEITDAEYDALTRALKKTEDQHPDWILPDSPTRHVGGSATDSIGAGKTKHKNRLLSLNDLFSIEDVMAWYQSIGSPVVSVEEKIDGLTIALTYRNGKLELAATRGDGDIGEIVTEQARMVADIPQTIPVPDGVPADNMLIVRAEVYQPIATFEALNEQQAALGLKLFANPRNCAAGGLRAKDPAITKERGLHAFSFHIIWSDGWDAVRSGKQTRDLALLKSLGFETVPSILCNNGQELIRAIDQIGKYKNNLAYWIDGAVIKTNDLKRQAEIGANDKYPMHSVAYKYPAETKRTTIRNIEIGVGRTGVLTPVAVFDPIQLSGTKVERATLHNQKFINDRMLNIGAEIEVLKSGEIIPKVVGVPVPAKEPYRIDRCPVCGAKAVSAADENGTSDTEIMLCPNMTGCPAQKLRYFEFFCSREVMDIAGMGPAVLSMLLDNHILENIWDIYNLSEPDKRDAIRFLNGFGPKKTENILKAIEKSKKNSLDRVIKALGIPGVGRHIGKALAKQYPDMEAIAGAPIEELTQIEGIGEISAIAIQQFWHDPSCVERYEHLRDAGVNMTSNAYKKADANGKLKGLTFVITGTLPSMSRENAKALIEEHDGKVSGSVSRKTSYLLAGEEAGSKLVKASSLGVPVITEGQLIEMLS